MEKLTGESIKTSTFFVFGSRSNSLVHSLSPSIFETLLEGLFSRSRGTKCEPIKPAPPVTRTLLQVLLIIFTERFGVKINIAFVRRFCEVFN